MKKLLLLLTSLILITYSSTAGSATLPGKSTSSSDSLKVMSTPDLYNLSVRWVGEYNKLFPETRIKVVTVSDAGTIKTLFEKGNIGFVSNEYISGLDNESVLKIVVGRDVIVPVINSKNPFLEEINITGVSPERFVQFFSSSNNRTWGTLLNGKQQSTGNYYSVNDESVSAALEGFLKTNAKMTGGSEVKSGGEMIAAIQKDQYAIGFCKLTDIIDPDNQTIVSGIVLLPVDRNGNGVIDYNEKIYTDLNDFSRGVWIGKYPKALISNIYSVLPVRPKSENETAFLKWILNDGQKYLYSSGYSDLLISERKTTTDKLIEAQAYQGAKADNRAGIRTLLIMLAALLLAGFAADILARYLRKRKTAEKVTVPPVVSVLDENSLVVPKGLYYDKTHMWAFMEQNGIVKVGVDDFMQHITGSLTRVIMKNQGEKVKKGDNILTITQNGKQLNLYSPVTGVIRKYNERLKTECSLINSSPYNEGWVYTIEPDNWQRENQLLFMSEKHKQFIKNEFSRLKDFLAESLLSDKELYAQVILQDGGELLDGTLTNLGPEVWEDFQSKFIDPSRQVWFYELF